VCRLVEVSVENMKMKFRIEYELRSYRRGWMDMGGDGVVFERILLTGVNNGWIYDWWRWGDLWSIGYDWWDVDWTQCGSRYTLAVPGV
jgi:hypothetical protein